MNLTAADGFKTIAADLGKDPVVSLTGVAEHHGELRSLLGIGRVVAAPRAMAIR